MNYFTFFFLCFGTVVQSHYVVYTYSTSQFRMATFQVVSSHMWLHEPPHLANLKTFKLKQNPVINMLHNKS